MKTNNILGLLEDFKVIIPPIQRDYAQGRKLGKIPYIREKFLNDIVNVLEDKSQPPLELDFIYGYEEIDKMVDDEIKIFKPLDGQQRLTTLFLLHWYISVTEGRSDEVRELLSKFSYATRKSSRDFCDKLIQFVPESNGKSIDQQIIDQPWFFSSWLNDPTIQSMLVVLNSLEQKFKGKENIWEDLAGQDPRIIFHLLSMDDLGLPDDLYIKMNARGKGLTNFEHFKSRFSEILDDESAKYFNEKIDKNWSDLFWNIFKEKESDDIAQEVDSGFLSFFWFITDILIRKKKIQIKSDFWLDKVKEVYNSRENVDFLFNSIDLFERLEKGDEKYFDDIFYIDPIDFDSSKTRIFFNNPQVNLFRKCVETYGFGDKKHSFSVGEQLMLYAFIYMSFNDSLDPKKFRFLRNIFASSEDQLRNEYLESFLYADVEFIIDDFNTVLAENRFSENSKLSRRQGKEEKEKAVFIDKNPEIRKTLYKLEDHNLQRGNISIFDLNESVLARAEKFETTFQAGCDYLSISNAMLTFGDYSQKYGSLRRYGNRTNTTWRELLTQSENRKDFENTKRIFNEYLEILINNPGTSNQVLVDNFLLAHTSQPDLPKAFEFYKIKYDSFTLWEENQTSGFFHWANRENQPYDCYMLFRKQFNGRHWKPFLLELTILNENCSIENYGDPIQYTNGDLILIIEHLNEGYKFTHTDDYSAKLIESLIASGELNQDAVLTIKKDENGQDVEDRIIKCNNFINAL